MCAVVAKLMQQFHILIPRDLHVTLCSVAVEHSVVSDLSTSSHGWAGTDGHSHIGGSWCYKLTPVCSSDGDMKKSPVMRLLLMHKNSVSLSGFPLGSSLPCFPLAPMFSYSTVLWGRVFPCRLSIRSHLFVLQGLSLALHLWASVYTPVNVCICNKVLWRTILYCAWYLGLIQWKGGYE